MVIYEVNLSIDGDVYPQFHLWLKKHVREMLEFPGFIQARILKPEDEQPLDKEVLVVQYKLENREFLEQYFTDFAPKMREEGINLFKDKFSAKRRILEVQDTFLK
jgi:antibiotic biosynthesis monooxygenase (ABM) superfamily enzyme